MAFDWDIEALIEYTSIVVSVSATIMGSLFLVAWLQSYPDASNNLLIAGGAMLAGAIMLILILFAESAKD